MKPRTMSAERELLYRQYRDWQIAVDLLAEIDAERLVNRKLAEALSELWLISVRNIRRKCTDEQRAWSANKITELKDAALTQYYES